MSRFKRFYGPTYLDPARPIEWPYEFDIVRPAAWPAGNWRLRKALARPLRGIVRMLRWMQSIYAAAADFVEGQPLVQQYWQEGWHRASDTRLAPFAYFGEVTPELRAMYRAHPERFAACTPALLAELRAEP